MKNTFATFEQTFDPGFTLVVSVETRPEPMICYYTREKGGRISSPGRFREVFPGQEAAIVRDVSALNYSKLEAWMRALAEGMQIKRGWRDAAPLKLSGNLAWENRA
jgi:hypothetical protein